MTKSKIGTGEGLAKMLKSDKLPTVRYNFAPPCSKIFDCRVHNERFRIMSPQFPIIIRRKLDRLHRSLRLYAALNGFAVLLLTVMLLCTLDFALDRFFEFSLLVRAIIFPLLVAATAYIFGEKIIFRCFAAIRRDQLATALEHYVPQLNEALVTTVEWGNNEEVNPELMQHTIDEAVTALRGVNVHRFFRIGRVFSRLLFSLLCAACVAAGYVYDSETVSLWFARNILLAQQEYPRQSELLVDGFQDGRVRIGRGDSFTLSVRANTDKPKIPESVRVRIGTPEVGYRTLDIKEFRTETREGTRWRVFSTTFSEMLETVNLQIRGADSTLNGLCIEVVPTPTLTEMVLNQTFPDYMQRSERAVPLTGRTMIPDGTKITITAKSTKPLREASAIINQTETLLTPESHGLFDEIILTLPILREETTVEFRLTDIDSLTNRHPIRAELGIIKDQPPIVTARLEGIGPAITSEAVLPIAGEITDDNGLATAVSRYTTEPAIVAQTETPSETLTETQREPTEGVVPVDGITSGQTLFQLIPQTQTFAVAPLALLPDDKLTLFVEASDLYDLEDTEGQVGIGPRWLLEIVTPEKLKELLETREITLRQRFEVVIGEVERTKSIMSDYSLEPMEQQVQQATAMTLESKANETEAERESRQRELETQKQKLLDTINLEQSELGAYHISRMLRDTHKEVYDLQAIVDAFETIRQEMINNRIFSEDERKRIDQEILQPMRELIKADFPGIDESLGILNQMLLERNVPNRPLALEERQKILAKLEATLLKMTTIRDKMASMESFNEAIELLRAIIKQQQQLRTETIEERNQRLKDLLD